jgi:hypothetical protein
MSEPTPEVTPEVVEPEKAATAEPTETPAPEDALGDAGKKAIDRMKAERDAARREASANKAAAKRLAELEESQKSEQQKIADRAAEAERERDEARTEGLRYKAAARHGVGEDYFDLLGSGDEETIVGRAERVGTLIRENAEMKAELEALRAGKPAPSTGRPTPALKPGATPEDNKTEDDVLYESLYGTQTSA